MKRLVRSRVMMLVVVVALAFSTVRCGTILYGSNRGGSRIDAAVLIMDCLWLLAGILPGVIALVVDFATGGIYEGGTKKHGSLNVHPGDSVAFRLRGAAPADATLDVSLGSVASGDAEQTLFLQSYAKGEVKKDISRFTIPSVIKPGAYKMTLRVNGIESASWDLKVDSRQ